MNLYQQDDILNLLRRVDEETALMYGTAAECGAWREVVLVGSSVLLASGLSAKPKTKDIDVLSMSEGMAEVLKEYRMFNSFSMVFGDYLPYNYEDRLVLIDIGSKAVLFKRPSNEDIAVMKLYAWRDPDIEDLEEGELGNSLDWDVMDELVYSADEARASVLSISNYKGMVLRYEQLAKKKGHLPNIERFPEARDTTSDGY